MNTIIIALFTRFICDYFSPFIERISCSNIISRVVYWVSDSGPTADDNLVAQAVKLTYWFSTGLISPHQVLCLSSCCSLL